MPSYSVWGRQVCPKCYVGTHLSTHTCGTETVRVVLSYKITQPKDRNKRAWKRILSGEPYWNRRKVRRAKRSGQRETYEIYEREGYLWETPAGNTVKRVRKVAGTEREVTNYGYLPDVDMGS